MRFKKTLASLLVAGACVFGTNKSANSEVLSYGADRGLAGYSAGLVDGQNNNESYDTLDNRGWEVVPETSNTIKYLTFKPVTDFQTFSPEDNYIIYHVHTDKPIDKWGLDATYSIQKNGFLESSVSGDKINWIPTIFSPFGPGSTAWNQGDYDSDWNGLNLKNDIYFKHSAGAISNQDYLSRIVSFHVNLVPEPNLEKLLGAAVVIGLINYFRKRK
jgi:hypothetical protein